MPKTVELQEVDMATDQAPSTQENYSISWLADYFCRSASWVKQRKTDLQEIWYWCAEDLVNESGSLTHKGFEQLQDLFDKTANSRIVTTLQGKRQSKPQKPQMTPGEYRSYIWTKHRKAAPDKDYAIDTDYAADHATSQDIEVIQGELDSSDVGSEIAENTALVKHQLSEVVRQNQQVFRGGLGRLKDALKQGIKHELAPVAQEALSEVYAELADEMLAEMPETEQQKVVKKTRKKSV